ncbi:hypothetical protein ALC62_01276 [Cyphomyrmex costatus]|uniref:Uncharacterized protein n=1 Tax=Cyphomyrmex costatus TaxID=456900 RepID=A0A195D4D8_9HYME|nr:hypothetical protein ALC62_01276 [Cyphomyrmex costatus]
MVLVREFTSIFISTRRQLFTLAAEVVNHSANSLTEYEGAIKRGGVSFRGMSRREAGRLRSRSLAPSLLSCSTPVDRRIKEDAPVETVRDLKRARTEDTPPVYTANVGSNSSWLVATKSIPHSQISSKSRECFSRYLFISYVYLAFNAICFKSTLMTLI